MKRRAASLLYFVTSMMGVLASTYETRVGMAAAYVLFAGSVVLFISKARWCLWLPFMGSAVLACYVVPSEIRSAIRYPAIFHSVQAATLNILLSGLVVLSLIVSAKGVIDLLFGTKRTNDTRLAQ